MLLIKMYPESFGCLAYGKACLNFSPTNILEGIVKKTLLIDKLGK